MSEYRLTAPRALCIAAKTAIEKIGRRAASALRIAALTASALALATTVAAAETRTLKLLFTHTGERAEITFKRNGKFDQKGLAQVNRILRDWRRNESTKMDPRLLDLVWEVYRRSGATNHIHVVSAYRSPATNNMLRGRSRNSGVAQTSQHTLGKAMDFFIPGVPIARLRAIAMQVQVGGVGYYPKSGSPFVHLDVGRVRAWPRMSRQELVRLFPNGQTLHVPADGKPLPGYNQAMADYKRRVSSGAIAVASTAGSARSRASSSSSDSPLLTAMLPTPKSRAREALEMQTTRQIAEKPPEFFDLAAISVPLPTFRVVEVEPDTPASITSFLPRAAFKVATVPGKTGYTLRQPSAGESELHMSSDGARKPQWTISNSALLGWALAPTHELERLTLPQSLRRTIASAAESRRTAGDTDLPAQSRTFDEGRLWSDG